MIYLKKNKTERKDTNKNKKREKKKKGSKMGIKKNTTTTGLEPATSVLPSGFVLDWPK